MTKKLYYHKTSGGAEYLFDRYIIAPNGEREGTIRGSSLSVRLDGKPEINFREQKKELIVAVVDVEFTDKIDKRSTAKEILRHPDVRIYSVPTFFEMFNDGDTAQSVNQDNINFSFDYAFLIDKSTMKVLNSYE